MPRDLVGVRGAGQEEKSRKSPVRVYADHQHQHRQLTDQSVPLRQQPHGTVVRGDDAEHVAGDDRDHLGDREAGRMV